MNNETFVDYWTLNIEHWTPTTDRMLLLSLLHLFKLSFGTFYIDPENMWKSKHIYYGNPRPCLTKFNSNSFFSSWKFYLMKIENVSWTVVIWYICSFSKQFELISDHFWVRSCLLQRQKVIDGLQWECGKRANNCQSIHNLFAIEIFIND